MTAKDNITSSAVNEPAVLVAADEVSLFGIASVLLKHTRFLSLAAVIGLAVGASFGLLSTRQYASSATFMPQSAADQSSIGGLALAASQFGVRMPSGGGTWGPSVYVELIKSRGILVPIANDSVTVEEMQGRRIPLFELLEINESNLELRTERTVRALRRIVTASENKKLGSVQLTVTTPWPSVSYMLTKRILDDVNRFNLQSRQSQAKSERKFAEAQAEEAASALRQAEDRMKEFLEQNRVVGSPELQNARDRLQRNITINQQTYISLLQSLGEARLREVRDTPVIMVLEAPTMPVIGEARDSAAKGVIGAIVSSLLGVIAVLIIHARDNSRGDVQVFVRSLDELLPRKLRRR